MLSIIVAQAAATSTSPRDHDDGDLDKR